MLATFDDPYAVSLVGTDGKVVAQASASRPSPPAGCGAGYGAHVPIPVSTSNSSAYFMDAQGIIRILTAQGAVGQVTTVPTGTSRYSAFAVSPDDRRIAVIVSDFAGGSASQRIYVEDLIGGTNHVDIFSSASGGSGLWPIGWHAGNLVLAVTQMCLPTGSDTCQCTQLRELHVVDPATADRRATLGSSQCLIVGFPSAAGVVCEDLAYTHADVVDWSGAVTRSIPIPRYQQAWLSPDGAHVAIDFNAVSTTLYPEQTLLPLYVCEWVDSTHVMSGLGNPVLVTDIVAGTTVRSTAGGGCAGRIPGAL